MAQPNIRPLSPFLAKLAQSEINENPKMIAKDLEALKLWLSQHSYLKSRTDDQFLIGFLRGCKFSLERTKEKLDTYYTLRSECPEFYGVRYPTNEKICQIANLGPTLSLPEPHTDGSRIVLSRVFCYDPNELKFSDIMKYSFMIGDQLILNDDNIMVAGVTVVVDLAGLSMAHAGQLTPTYISKISTAVQDAYPFRQKGIHFLNAPSIFDVFFKLFQNFLGSKLKKRLFIHDSLESLHKHVPKDLLPEEYGGGKIGKLENLTNNCRDELLSKRDWFLNDEQYGTDETKRKCAAQRSHNNNNNNDLVYENSIDGSFRKLEFD